MHRGLLWLRVWKCKQRDLHMLHWCASWGLFVWFLLAALPFFKNNIAVSCGSLDCNTEIHTCYETLFSKTWYQQCFFWHKAHQGCWRNPQLLISAPSTLWTSPFSRQADNKAQCVSKGWLVPKPGGGTSASHNSSTCPASLGDFPWKFRDWFARVLTLKNTSMHRLVGGKNKNLVCPSGLVGVILAEGQKHQHLTRTSHHTHSPAGRKNLIKLG